MSFARVAVAVAVAEAAAAATSSSNASSSDASIEEATVRVRYASVVWELPRHRAQMDLVELFSLDPSRMHFVVSGAKVPTWELAEYRAASESKIALLVASPRVVHERQALRAWNDTRERARRWAVDLFFRSVGAVWFVVSAALLFVRSLFVAEPTPALSVGGGRVGRPRPPSRRGHPGRGGDRGDVVNDLDDD